MARGDTYDNMLDDVFDEEIEKVVTDIEIEELKSPPLEEEKLVKTESRPAAEEKKPELKSKSTKKSVPKKPVIDFGEKEETVPRSFRIPPEINKAIDSIVNEGGKQGARKRKGSRGFLKAFVSNAFIKELIELGVLEEGDIELFPYE